jgi:hypothetical protein
MTLLSAVLYPSLASPVKQDEIHEGRKRIDITYLNEAKHGFFDWLARHHPASHVFFECKNYGKEVGNPELDQLSGEILTVPGPCGCLSRAVTRKPSVVFEAVQRHGK